MITTLAFAVEAKTFLSSFPALWAGLAKSRRAQCHRNKDELTQRILETVQSALILIQSQRIAGAGIAYFSTEMAQFLRPYAISAKALNALTIVIGTIDLFIEAQGLFRCRSFRKAHPLPSASLSKTEQGTFVQKQLQTLFSSYFSLSSQELHRVEKKLNRFSSPSNFLERYEYFDRAKQRQLKYKQLTLNRCVGTHFTEQLQNHIPLLLSQLDRPAWLRKTSTIDEGMQLLERMDRQVQKQQLLHYVGIGVALLTILSGILLFVPLCPAAIGLAVGSIALVLYYSCAIVKNEFMESEGWSFSWKKALHRSLIQPITSMLPTFLSAV